MKILTFSNKYYEAITNNPDKKRFLKKYFSGLRTFANTPIIETSLFDAKTLTQNGAIWGDWSIVADLMYTDKNVIYYWCIKAPQLADCWIEKCSWGKENRKSYRFITLSEFSKDHIIETNFITRYRDFLQGIVNKEYGEYIYIKWYQNLDKLGIDHEQT